MNIIFITNFLHDEKLTLLKSKGKPISIANSTYQKTLLYGLSRVVNKSDKICCINIPNIGSYPINFNSPFNPSSSYSINEVPTQEISFINISYLKHFYINHGVFRHLEEKLKEWENITVICYDLSGAVHNAINRLKKKYSFHCVTIVPDLPNMTGTPDLFLYKLNKLLPHFSLPKDLNHIDAFVLFSESMKEKLPINNKQSIVLEGIYDENTNEITTEIDNNDTIFQILYSGAMSVRNGVLDLINDVLNIENKNVKLILCGTGELDEKIKALEKKNPQIVYMGQIPRDEVLMLQKKVNLLVNPRRPELEFANYSFPSKTMEYMASSTPVLMYNLPSLPEDYHKYLFFIDPHEDKPIQKAIESITVMKDEERRDRGNAARRFILNNKNPFIQAKKLYQMVKSIEVKNVSI